MNNCLLFEYLLHVFFFNFISITLEYTSRLKKTQLCIKLHRVSCPQTGETQSHPGIKRLNFNFISRSMPRSILHERTRMRPREQHAEMHLPEVLSATQAARLRLGRAHLSKPLRIAQGRMSHGHCHYGPERSPLRQGR